MSDDSTASENSPDEVTYFSRGLQIRASYFRPSPTAGRSPAVVLCPGFTGTRQEPSNRLFAPGLAAGGYAVLVPDYRGWGESEGERGVIDPIWQVEDVRAGLSYLETRDDVDPDRLGLFGLSFGGAIATYAAAVDTRACAMVSVLGVGDGPSWLRSLRREYEWVRFLEEVAADRLECARTGRGRLVDPTEELMLPTPERIALKGRGSAARTPLACADALLQFRPVDVVHRIAPRAALWLNVRHDPVVPYEQAQALHAAAGEPKRLVALSGRDHYGAYERHRRRIHEEAIAWFEQQLHRGDTAVD